MANHQTRLRALSDRISRGETVDIHAFRELVPEFGDLAHDAQVSIGSSAALPRMGTLSCAWSISAEAPSAPAGGEPAQWLVSMTTRDLVFNELANVTGSAETEPRARLVTFLRAKAMEVEDAAQDADATTADACLAIAAGLLCGMAFVFLA